MIQRDHETEMKSMSICIVATLTVTVRTRTKGKGPEWLLYSGKGSGMNPGSRASVFVSKNERTDQKFLVCSIIFFIGTEHSCTAGPFLHSLPSALSFSNNQLYPVSPPWSRKRMSSVSHISTALISSLQTILRSPRSTTRCI